jgi:hypothetical protein
MDPQLEAQLTDIHFGVSKLLALIEKQRIDRGITPDDWRSYPDYQAAIRFCLQMGDICDTLKEIL